jgi:hypothetical protein
MFQKGGLEPLLKTPTIQDFKYTFDKKRIIWIQNMYPYIDVFINTIRDIKWDEYNYDGVITVKTNDDNSYQLHNCVNKTAPVYYFTGGCVYEILNKKYRNVDLYSYCDPTGDIDVALYPPKLTEYEHGYCVFLDSENKIEPFYRHFTQWTFDEFVRLLKRNILDESKLDEMFPSMVSFDIDEYEEVPAQYKNPDFGYQLIQIGKLFVVSFLDKDNTMFKIQVVCKIQEDSVSVIDHVVEIILPLPTGQSDADFSPTYEGYKIGNYNTVEFSNNNKYNIQPFQHLINDNIDAYLERKPAYSSPNYKDIIHKPINHVARLFYLYELFYQNTDLFYHNKTVNLLFLGVMREAKKKQLLPNFLYYKRVLGEFIKIDVSVRDFLSAYYNLLLQNVNITRFNIQYKNFFEEKFYKINDKNMGSPENQIFLKEKHDLFIRNLKFDKSSKKMKTRNKSIRKMRSLITLKNSKKSRKTRKQKTL